ncbi:cell division protein ZapA [Clostridium sp.]|uniref:cell division protein ZapA n=1 Tax=Clostridium sp. TaxID=1506 RepID=UPI0026165704|nr:cell division protein ZapA [Clostridium sp.]
MNRVTIKINGVEYNLKGRENEEYLVKVANYVDSKVKDIQNASKGLSSTAIATLASLNISDELFKADIEIESLLKKNTSLEERNNTLKERIKELKDSIEERDFNNLRIIEKLKNKISKLEENKNSEVIMEELNIKSKEINDFKEALEIKEEHYFKEVEGLNKEYEILSEEYNKVKNNSDKIKVRYKENKFQLQNAKYRILDLEKKLLDTRIDLAKEKKKKNALLKNV